MTWLSLIYGLVGIGVFTRSFTIARENSSDASFFELALGAALLATLWPVLIGSALTSLAHKTRPRNTSQ